MENWYGAALCKEARSISRGQEKTKISAIHAGISAGVALAVTLLYFVLEKGIAQTGGLSGMGTRSILQTISTLLTNANAVLVPFWNLGFWFVALLWARKQNAKTGDLLAGFRRFGAYLRLLLNRGLLTVAVGFVSIYISSYIYMLTPWSASVMEFAQSTGMDMNVANERIAGMDMAQMDAMLRDMLPMLVIWLVLFALLVLPMLYKFRMAEFFLLDDRRMGTVRAMFHSSQMLRKRRWKLFRLDLRFWWYFVAQGLCFTVYTADLWLPLLGVTLSGGILTSMGLYVLYLTGLFLVQTFLRPRVQTAYALAYEQLLRMEPVMPKIRPAPQNLPWDEQ